MLLFLQDMISYKSRDAIGYNAPAEREPTSSVARREKWKKANGELAIQRWISQPGKTERRKEVSKSLAVIGRSWSIDATHAVAVIL